MEQAGYAAPTCGRAGSVPGLSGRGPRGGVAGSFRAPAAPRIGPGSREAAGGARTAELSGGRSCSRTARRRLGAARREPRGAGGRGTPCLAASSPGRRPAHDGTSSMSSGYSSLEEDAEDFFFTARTSFFRRAPQGKPRAGQQVTPKQDTWADFEVGRLNPAASWPWEPHQGSPANPDVLVSDERRLDRNK
ncbi:hypothetical protein J1605_008639 [Eschrichtius robustus]|uniref:Uncharacterized protein n=1 Tax=Eschrichtius robustus TaxID=9764 RepID=A0AB34GT09_ESCRO|nr:hypothetical protein J1605_008639 [Eschrichtius robustus]